MYNSVDIVRVLINHGVNVDAQDANQRTALHIAVDMQVPALASPAVAFSRRFLMRSPPAACCDTLQHIHCAAMLLGAGASLSIQDAKARPFAQLPVSTAFQ
jgi:hypothetical protein